MAILRVFFWCALPGAPKKRKRLSPLPYPIQTLHSLRVDRVSELYGLFDSYHIQVTWIRANLDFPARLGDDPRFFPKSAMASELRETLNLPKTEFPMRANLVQREPDRLAHWEAVGVYRRIQEKNRDGESFILHDGPPFTNGDLHLGHALNKTLKDTVLRYKWMRGYRAPYVPGWDSHGLPIEHKVSRELQEKGIDHDSPLEIRQACKDFADHFRKTQTEQFKRLGLLADWENEYWTIHPEYEASELETFAKFVEKGLVYRSKKPVYWSIPCGTALAEAEIEYRPHRSPSIYVNFPLTAQAAQQLELPENSGILIWTTTPWTLPANLAIALHPELEYVVLAVPGAHYIVAAELAEAVAEHCELESVKVLKRFSGKDLENIATRHPFIDRISPVVLADYVTTESGTGCVHTAPGHGVEDYLTGKKYGLEIYCPLDDEGCYVDDGQIPPELVGLTVLENKGKSPANLRVLQLLDAKGALLKLDHCEHSYPHCWRSKTPVVFRAMDQWFIALDEGGSRKRALEEIEKVRFVPKTGKVRMQEAVRNRPDWCISRQRSWGVPLPAFYSGDGQAWIDAGVIREIAKKIRRHGTDLWYEKSPAMLLKGIDLPPEWPSPKELRAGTDTLDVWIDSGCSHQAVLRQRENLQWPADLYLEGSDQHRGWFQSSLWTGVIADQGAPYRTILTHGFIVREDRTKLSKSSGDARSLMEWVNGYGADVLRLWICSQDYRGDVPVSDKIVKNVSNNYRNIRNTLRFQLSNLYDFDPSHNAIPLDQMHPLDRWVLHELGQLVEEVTDAYEAYEFHRAFKDHLDRFCSHTLSATYHDILKDRLYTLAPDDPLRRSSQTAIHIIFSVFTRLIAPLLPFTTDEAWSHARGHGDFSHDPIAIESWPEADPAWQCPEVAGEIRALRRFLQTEINDKLEALRQWKVIGQSLDAKAEIKGPPANPTFALLTKYQDDLPELFILSQVRLRSDDSAEDLSVSVDHADGVRCPRSWRWVPRLVKVDPFGEVSERCAGVLRKNNS